MISLQIKMPEKDSSRIKALLAHIKTGAPQVMVGAINSTLTEVRSDMVAAVKSILTISAAVVEQAIRIEPATPQNLSGSLEVSGGPLPLSAFNNQQTPSGISVLVKRGRLHSIIPGTFFVKLKSGRRGIFWRERHASKYPIRQLFSSSVPQIVGDGLPAILQKADEHLQTHIKSGLADLLKQ